MQPIIRQADQYPRDYKKSIWTPEEEALGAELLERLRYKQETGELPTLDASNPEHLTYALQEMILMNKERAERADADELDLGYDPAFNDWEAGQV